MNSILLSLMLLSQPADTPQIPSDEEILRTILDDSGLGVAGPQDSGTDVVEYRNDVRRSLPFIRSLFSRMARSSAEFLRIQEAIALDQLRRYGVDVGLEVIASFVGGVGPSLITGSHESSSGRRWIHIGFGGRVFICEANGCNVGVFAGFSGRRFLNTNPESSMSQRIIQNGGALGIAVVSDYQDQSSSNRGLFVGAGLGMVSTNDASHSVLRIPIIPLPYFLGSSTGRAVRSLERLQSKIVISFHYLDLHTAEKHIAAFERKLASLKISLANRWSNPPSFHNTSLPAMHPFNSLGSLYHPSRIDGLNKGLLRTLVRACRF